MLFRDDDMLECNNSATIPRRVVVIGASGFIGSALIVRFQQLNLNTLALSSKDINLIEEKSWMLLAELLRADDTIIILSAITPDKSSGISFVFQNIAIGNSICLAVQKAKCAHVIYISSDAVYPFIDQEITELCKTESTSLYSAIHITRELMIRNATNTPIAIIRPTQVYGQSDTHNAYGPCRMINSAQHERKITLFGNGEDTRDHIFINDLVELTVLIIFHQGRGTLNAATGISISFQELAKIIQNQFGEFIEIVNEQRKQPIYHRKFDIENLISTFPSFSFTSLDKGISIMCKEAFKQGQCIDYLN